MLARLALSLTLAALSISAIARAQPPSFSVQVEGKGPAMILIPGLNCGGEVWRETVNHYKGRYEVHTLTLAGFAGQPAIDKPLLETVRKDLTRYIQEKHLNKPVVMGHSLGGFLAELIASTDPASVGAVIAVDGVPFLPALFDAKATVKTAEPQAAQLRDRLRSLPIDAYRAGARASVTQLVTDPAQVERVAKMSYRSDPWTSGGAIYELMTTDLRDRVAKISAPLLLLAAGGILPEEQRESARARYEAQVAAAPHHKVVMVENARHFIMLDSPEVFLAQVDGFLAQEGK